ncbi:MAG: NAD-dependent epimerase/dehydratase family protein [Ignavibacteriaceae bacterium]
MKVLVTGGTGFTGSALVLRLVNLGHSVKTLDYKEGIRVQQLKDAGVDVIIGSITDKDLVDKITENVDFVFHVAAAFRELDVPSEHYYNVNVNGTRNVFDAAKKHSVKKVVYCSTQGVHGHISNPPGNENSPIAPEDYYQQTKYEGELVAQEFMKGGMKVTIIRPTAIYGPGDPERFYMIFKRVKNGSFPMFGKGETFYHPVYIDNLVDAFILSMDLEKGNGQTYIIADEEYLPIKELVKRVGKAMNREVKIKFYPILPLVVAGHVVEKVCKPFGIAPPIFPRRVDWFRQVRAFSIDKAKRELGYIPKVGIDEGLRNTAEWYEKMGYFSENAKDLPKLTLTHTPK